MMALSDSQVSWLSGKFDFSNMSDEDYDGFLDHLKDEGFLTQEDMPYLGYGGIIVEAGSGSYSLPDIHWGSTEFDITNLRAYSQAYSQVTDCVLANGQRDTVRERRVALLGKISHLLQQIPKEK